VARAVGQLGIPRIPVSLRWDGEPASSYRMTDDGFDISAGPGTDLFIEPERTAVTLNAPHLLAAAEGDFLLSARVRVEFEATFDAGALLVWLNDRAWAKLAFELSPQREPMVVSVVTRGTSDDCNSFVVEDGHVWLRVARVGTAYAFHASTDGVYWRLIRHFSLYASETPSYGFSAQSPTGAGCTATFDAIAYEPRRLLELRDGS
jgi:regulation of enolase protein 1 (concanavalin A-like superfamily)